MMKSPPMVKLYPRVRACPACGHEIEYIDVREGEQGFHLVCPTCGLHGPQHQMDLRKFNATREAAIYAWNELRYSDGRWR